MPVTGGDDFRGLKPLWHLVSRLKWIPGELKMANPENPPLGNAGKILYDTKYPGANYHYEWVLAISFVALSRNAL